MDIFKEFVFKGTRNTAIRSDKKMKNIDKTIADKAFKIQKSG